MKKQQKFSVMMAIMLALGLLILLNNAVYSQPRGDYGAGGGKGFWGKHQGPQDGKMFHVQLTEEQRKELADTIKKLKEEGKTREEIRTAVDALFEKWGIEKPDHWGDRHFGKHPFMDKLTDVQRKELADTVKKLKEEGKTCEEIRTAVNALFEKWGIEKPDSRLRHRGWKQFAKQLTPEQRQQIWDTIKDMKAKDATREEIHEAVKALLIEFGVDLPEDWSDNKPNEPVGIKNANKTIATASNFPNPFNPETRITYTLNKPGQVKIRIYNVQGQFIKTLLDEYQNPGTYSSTWNGKTDNGETIPSGMYFYRINVGGETLTQRMTLMK